MKKEQIIDNLCDCINKNWQDTRGILKAAQALGLEEDVKKKCVRFKYDRPGFRINKNNNIWAGRPMFQENSVRIITSEEEKKINSHTFTYMQESDNKFGFNTGASYYCYCGFSMRCYDLNQPITFYTEEGYIARNTHLGLMLTNKSSIYHCDWTEEEAAEYRQQYLNEMTIKDIIE